MTSRTQKKEDAHGVFFFGRNEVSSQAARRVRRQIVRTHIVALLLVSIWVRITVTSRTQKKKTRTASSLFGRNEVIEFPRFSGFRASSPLFKKPHIYAVFCTFHFCVYKLKIQIFRKFVYDSCTKRSKQNFFSMVYFFAPNNLLYVAELSQIFVCIIILQASSFESDTALVKKLKRKIIKSIDFFEK